jgi:hypothetical protein
MTPTSTTLLGMMLHPRSSNRRSKMTPSGYTGPCITGNGAMRYWEKPMRAGCWR